MQLTVLIPTYNEAGNIADFLSELSRVAPDAKLLVVDDNSPDGTGTIVKGLALKNPQIELLHREKKEGLGKAYLHAFTEVLRDARTESVLMMDADFSHDPEYISQMREALTDADVVIGSRYCAGGATEGWERWRKALSKYGNLYAGLITQMPVRDMTAGFCLIRASLLRKLDLKRLGSSGYAFQIELKYRLFQAGARIREVPIHFKNRREGESKISRHIIREGIIAPWLLRFKK
ncbi:polyprenol monophosphomannose synthase [bacterium]|nr:polyprenol monophosphomannose synthase [bacterium]